MPSRRPSPLQLLVVLVVACLAPLAVVVATGLAYSPIDSDGVETADGDGGEGGDGGGSGDGGADALRYGGEDAPGSDRAGGRASSTTAAPTTSSTATTIPPTTAPPATAPPTTAAPPPPPPAPPPPPPAPPPPASATDQVVALVNQARDAAGCGPVTVNGALTAAAQAHSNDMGANDYFSHTSQDGRTFGQRISAAGYGGGYLGENIARGQRSAQAVHDAWMASSGHRRNILDCDFTAIGVGLHSATWTWTQDFGG